MTSRTCKTWTDLKAEDTTSDSDEDESPATDAMLGGLRLGMNTIRAHTRATVGKCDTVASKNDMINRLENSTLNLIRGEKMFMETSRIVAGIVDDITSDSEDEEGDGTVFKANANHNWDKLMPKLPGPIELIKTREKMAKMLDSRMHDFEGSLTKFSLETHPKYLALQKQITLGEEDFARKHSIQDEVAPCQGATDNETHGFKCPTQDTTDYGDESSEGEDEVLPSKDPISKKCIMNPVRNKYCNHVFEESSIIKFIESNPGSRCPMFACTNTKPLEETDLITNSGLTNRIRNKNTCY